LPPSLSFSPNVVSNSTLKLCFLQLVNAELKRNWIYIYIYTHKIIFNKCFFKNLWKQMWIKLLKLALSSFYET
jgi:hypothetical protein